MGTSVERPNIVFIMVDDMMTLKEAQDAPQLQRILAGKGVSFTNAFATNSLCCPSRATALTGQYAHNHEVKNNARPDGGYETFKRSGAERETVAVDLDRSGYRTALFGRYLNGSDSNTKPPGWDVLVTRAGGASTSTESPLHIGEHGLPAYKRTPYEEAIRVPLMIRDPDINPGTEVDEIALNNDLAPAIVDIAANSGPETSDGRSLYGLAGGKNEAPWRNAFMVEGWRQLPTDRHVNGLPIIPTHKAVRTERYLYVEYETGERELYDLKADPYELENIVEKAEPALLKVLKGKLEKLEDCVGENCRAAEDAVL